MMTLTPAYGRDYKSKAAIAADLLAGKDFTANSFDGQCGYINLPQLREIGLTTVNVRYNSIRSVAVIDLRKLEALAAPKPAKPRVAKVKGPKFPPGTRVRLTDNARRQMGSRDSTIYTVQACSCDLCGASDRFVCVGSDPDPLMGDRHIAIAALRKVGR